MDTPRKVKAYTERTRAKDRTCKNKRGRKGTQDSDWVTYGHHPIGEGLKPEHHKRALSRDAINAIFTRTDVFLPLPLDDNQGHDGHVHVDVASQPRWRRRMKTVVNPMFRSGKKG